MLKQPGCPDCAALTSGDCGQHNVARDYPNARDCKHGQLRRACDQCEHEREVADLRTENAALAAQVEHLVERVHKADGMAREVNLLTAENRSLAAQVAAQVAALLAVWNAAQAWVCNNNPLCGDSLCMAVRTARAALDAAGITEREETP